MSDVCVEGTGDPVNPVFDSLFLNMYTNMDIGAENSPCPVSTFNT